MTPDSALSMTRLRRGKAVWITRVMVDGPFYPLDRSGDPHPYMTDEERDRHYKRMADWLISTYGGQDVA